MQRLVLFMLCAFAVHIPAAFADSLTHLGQPVQELVTIVYDSDDDDFPINPHIVRPNGLVQDFKIPEGQLLVITDIDWQLEVDEGSDPDDPSQKSRGAAAVRLTDHNKLVYSSAPVLFTPLETSNPVLVAGGHENLTAGIVIANAKTFGVNLRTNLEVDDLIDTDGSHVILYGYFMPNPNYLVRKNPPGAPPGVTQKP